MAQPSIDSTHMPAPGDVVIRTVVNNVGDIDFVPSDSNMIWDFSVLDGVSSIGDTFIGVLSTPFTYIATFNNPFDQEHKASVASRQPPMQSAPGITITNMYNFYKSAYGYYGIVGFGAEVNSIPIPVKYDHADTIYNYPLTFGNIDSSFSQYDINIPNLGYNAERKHRTNYVDGWGTLYLPGDTFDVIRIRSVLRIFDSIYIDSLGFGIGFNRNETEYKWIATESKLPVLQVTQRQGGGMGGNSTDAWFLDNRDHSGFPSTANTPGIRIYPNPGKDVIYIIASGNNVLSCQIRDMQGRLVLNGNCDPVQGISVSSLIPGLYFITITHNESTTTELFIKQ